MRKNRVRLAVIALLTVAFLFFFFRSVDWREVARYLAGVNIPIFVLTLLLVPLHMVTRSWRWGYLLEHEKRGITLWSRFAANTVGFTVNFVFPGRLGEVVRPLYLAQKENLRKGFALGTIVVERMFDLFVMCFLLGAFLLARPLHASRFTMNAETYANLRLWLIIGLAFGSALLLLSLALYFFREKTLGLISFLLRPFPRWFSQRVVTLSEEFIAGLKFFHSLRTFGMYAASSFVIWLAIIFYYWLFLLAFRISVPYFLMIPYVFLTGVGASIPTPGMVGGFHYFSKLGLTALYGTDPNLAVGVSILVHAEQVVVTAIIGYAILWKEGMTLFQLKKLGEDESR